MKSSGSARCRRWLPGRRRRRRAKAAPGSGWAATGAGTAGRVLCNYDILEAHASGSRLAVCAPRFDESHYCNGRAPLSARRRRSRSPSASNRAGCAALTGTPILNRPKDLVAQLRLIGRLCDFGSGDETGPTAFRGAQSLDRLHWHLRAHCYVRRTKAAVLPQLPPKSLATVPLELDNLGEYLLAEQDVIAWLHTQPLDLRTLEARVAAALRAEQLARLNYLRRLAARGKLRAAIGWIEDFVASGEPLVVFAHHREVQAALMKRFPAAAHVLGSDEPRRARRRGRRLPTNGGPPLVVCSMQARRRGIHARARLQRRVPRERTMDARAPRPAEDRGHRIGQVDAVPPTTARGRDGDEQMAVVLQRKRGRDRRGDRRSRGTTGTALTQSCERCASGRVRKCAPRPERHPPPASWPAVQAGKQNSGKPSQGSCA